MKRAILAVLLWLRIPVLTIASTPRAHGYVTVVLWQTPKVAD